MDVPLWQFYRYDELNGDHSNWFGPNIGAVTDAFGSTGFDVEVLARWPGRAASKASG